jgi:hypothetical protein
MKVFFPLGNSDSGSEQKFIDFGFLNVLAYPGSWKEWKKAGNPIET